MCTARKTIVLPCELSQLDRLRQFVTEVCGTLHADAHVAAQLNLALEEVFVNIINYAYPQGEVGSTELTATCGSDDSVVFTVVDTGMAFDPTQVAEADVTLDAASRPVGGLGIHIVRHMVDELRYRREQGRNVLTLKKKINKIKTR